LTIGTANADYEADVGATSVQAWCVLLEVRDNGLGMSDEVQSIFSSLFTTETGGRTGWVYLRQGSSQSNGYIWVKVIGTGTAQDIPARIEEAFLKSAGKDGPFRGTETILLVEDNDLVRQLARSVLEHYGYHLLEAQNGRSLPAQQGVWRAYPALLTDVVMPGVSGQTLAEQIKFIRPEIEILFMSGYSEEATLRPGDPDLRDHFLQKPFSPSELGKRVRELLDLRSA
jgi:CheY-like chemotaxis protein